jgi:hemoglobin
LTELSPQRQSPFEAIGGGEAIRGIVDRFYDLMDGDPSYRDLRMLHAEDLTPMRRSLTGFLTGWIGGPRDWFVANPRKCMMSVHAPIAISDATAEQWVRAMSEAIKDCDIDAELANKINGTFAAMASGMVRRE